VRIVDGRVYVNDGPRTDDYVPARVSPATDDWGPRLISGLLLREGDSPQQRSDSRTGGPCRRNTLSARYKGPMGGRCKDARIFLFLA